MGLTAGAADPVIGLNITLRFLVDPMICGSLIDASLRCKTTSRRPDMVVFQTAPILLINPAIRTCFGGRSWAFGDTPGRCYLPQELSGGFA